MVKQLNGLLHWNRYFPEAACAIALLLLSVQPAFSATKPDGTIEITDGKEQFMSTLASMPYTSSGAGPVLYVLECSKCKSSQAFETDWKGQLDGVELRRFLIALNAAAANETAYLARTRDINDFYAIMNQTKVAPPIKACNCPDDNKAIQAFNSVEKPFKTVLLPTIMKNGWSKGGPPPQFMWETNGHVYVSGYSKASFQEILSMLRSGTQTKEASASPPRTPASDSSPAETTGQVMTAEKNSPKPAGDAPTSDSGSKSAARGGVGPDVIGLRIGSTPDEARAILKSRGFGSSSCETRLDSTMADMTVCSSRSGNKPIDDYRERVATLNFTLPGGTPQTIPNTKYMASIRGFIRHLDTDPNGKILQSEDHGLDLLFGPNPGQERIVSLHRFEELPADKRPTFDAFEKALLEKYGPASFSPPGYREQLYWIYDRNGTLRKPGATSKDYVGTCNAPTSPPSEDWIMREGSGKLQQSATKCGAIVLFLIMNFEAVTYAGPNSIVSGYNTDLTGFDAALQAYNASTAIKDKAQAEASGAAIKKGQQQKPNL